MESESFVKSSFSGLGTAELLTSSVEALNGSTAAQASALRQVLGITTVFDLAASQLLHTLRTALNQARPRLAGDVLDPAPAADLALADAPLSALRAVGAVGADTLRAALGVTTVGELALWPPGQAARDLLAHICTPEQAPGFDPEAPADLLPRVGEHATDKVFYRTLLVDSVAGLLDQGAGTAIENAEPLDLGPALGADTPFRRVAVGALLSFSQSWFAQGLALGQLLHSLSLAPGESTRMAMIDWSRQSRGRGSEAVNDSERLANTSTHQRALSEVTQATAAEVQGGDTLVSALVLPSDLALAIEVRRRDGSVVPLVEPGPSGARFLAPEAVRELASVSLRSALIVPRETTVTLQLNLQGTVSPVAVPVTLQPGGPLSGLQRVLSFDPPPEQDELRLHLKANALHYTQAVLRTLDASVLSAMLARLSFGGVPLAQWVDHRPVAVTANYLVFKAGLPDHGAPPDPALAALAEAWQQFLATAGLVNAAPRRELMMMPTGGVFAEAVLGRSVAGEKLDSTRFFDWQESPIPLVASEIAPLEAGTRASDETLTPTNPSAPVVNIQAPTALPDPTGLAAVLGALGAKNLFNDLSGADATLKLAQALQKVGAAGATSGGALAAQTLKTVMEQNTERLRTAAKVAAAMAGVPPVGAAGGGGAGDGGQGDGKASNTVAGGLENRAKALDQAKTATAAGAPGAQGAGARSAATDLQQRQSGATAAGTAARILDAVTQGTQTSEGAAAAGSGSAAGGPRRLTLELRGSQLLRDATLFDSVPLALQLQVKERDGTLVASRSGIDGGSSLRLPIASASPSLTAEVGVVLQSSWPQPRRIVLNRQATATLDSVKATLRLDLVAQVQQQQQFISAGPNPPDHATLIAVLKTVAFDLDTILKKPVVEANAAGEFIARFPQLALLRVNHVPD